MNDKKTAIVFALIVLIAISTYAQQYDSESDFSVERVGNEITITSYIGTKTEVRIPPRIQGLPVTCIGDWAFFDCTSLTSINIPNSVTSINDGAFLGCTGLASINIPDSVTSIGGGIFQGCSGLTSITIPSSVTSIGDWVFFECTSLTAITVAAGNTAYISENGVLYNKDKTSLLAYPPGKTGSFTIPNSVTSIGLAAFCTTGLSGAVTIPAGVNSIEDWGLSVCTGLTAITVAAGNSTYASENGVLYNKDKTILIAYPAGKTGSSFTIPNSVTSIGFAAFSGCTSLAGITIPNSVTSIEAVAFHLAAGLTSITIPDSVTSIGHDLFYGCTSLTSVIIGKGITNIESDVFENCSSLASIIIPGSVTRIESGAFSGCDSLTSVTFDSTISFSEFSTDNNRPYPTFPGDLHDKFYATDKDNGTPGTYTRPSGNSETWTRQ